MSNVAKLKKRALEYEQKKQLDKALETYVQILGDLGDHVDEADVALYNRVGDLMLRQGDVARAVDHYERAVDLYTDGGFFNNAIALCNKILRNAPGRNSIYYKLGKISAKKGFINDAKQNFLEYADRMQRVGELEEAFRALKEFADLCPDQDDIRLMLADQLVRKDRKGEAIEQLQLLYDKFRSEGRTKEARATVDRMKAIDPEFEPKVGSFRPTPKANDLIFLDVNYDEPVGGRGGAAPARQAHPAPPPPEPRRAAGAAPEIAPDAVPEPPLSDADIELPLLEVDAEPESTAGAVDGLSLGAGIQGDRPDVSSGLGGEMDIGLITGFEQTSLDADEMASPPPIEPLAEIERAASDSLADAGLDLSLVRDERWLDGGDAPEPSLAGDLPFIAVPPETPEVPESEEAIGGELTFLLSDDTTPESSATPAVERSDDEGDIGGDLGLAIVYQPEPELVAGELEPVVSEDVVPHAAAAARRAPAASAVDRLREAVAATPRDWDLHRRLGEALLESGDRRNGIEALERAMLGLETDGELRGASGIAEELILVEPGEVRHHQKRVEYAVRANDKSRLVDAYLALAESLFRSGQLDKSRAVYGRVLELAPDEARALAALQSLGRSESRLPTPPELRPVARSAPPAAPMPAAPPAPPQAVPADVPSPEPRHAPVPRGADRDPAPAVAAGSDDSFVNLADWLREDESQKSTRMVVDVGEPQDQEQVDFAEMLTMFKQGVAANVDETDHESHYDLGIAYKEMGLLDEAISEFQKALRGTEQRVRTYEALGQCFVEKGQHQIALTILSRALNDKTTTDDMLVGVLYLLGYASEALERWQDALRFYERVFAVDIQFRDIGDRLAVVEARVR